MRALISVASWFSVQVEHDLRQRGMLVSTAEDCETLIELLPLVGRAALILDTGLPTVQWTKIIEQIRHKCPNAPVLALCDSQRLEDEIMALSKGADDVLTPRMEADEIMARVMRVATRRAGFPSPVLNYHPLEIDTFHQDVRWFGLPVSLTPSQYHILEAVALRPGCFVNNDELLDLLYGTETAADSQAIRVFVSHLRRRLREAGANEVEISCVSRMGFRLTVQGSVTPVRAGPPNWGQQLLKSA